MIKIISRIRQRIAEARADHARQPGVRTAGQAGFTLIETFVAISILTISIIAPMSLAAQSISISYYARDEITASYLAQEAIETIHNVRDSNILEDLLTGDGTDQMHGIPYVDGTPFTVDAHFPSNDVADMFATQCSGGTCPPIKFNGEFYGYSGAGTWVPTNFTRTITAKYIDSGNNDLRLTVTVAWNTGVYQTRSITLTEDLYRWAKSNQP